MHVTGIPVDKAFERQTEISIDDTMNHQWKATERIVRKKREIRVFVSSTFKDFTNEREEIIKKAFRKVRFSLRCRSEKTSLRSHASDHVWQPMSMAIVII